MSKAIADVVKALRLIQDDERVDFHARATSEAAADLIERLSIPATLTHKRLKRLFNYDPVTGQLIWAVLKGKIHAGTVGGTDRPDGYRKIKIDGKYYQIHRVVWFYVHGEWPATELDHINRNKKDNRACNLRLTNRHQQWVNTHKYDACLARKRSTTTAAQAGK